MEGGKFTAPPKESVKACSPRLTEFVEMVNPKLVILVGRESAKAWQNLGSPIKTEEIVHPAAVLRATGAAAASRSLMIKNAIVTLRDAFEEL
jgi:uracil-DNA glycosylase